MSLTSRSLTRRSLLGIGVSGGLAALATTALAACGSSTPASPTSAPTVGSKPSPAAVSTTTASAAPTSTTAAAASPSTAASATPAAAAAPTKQAVSLTAYGVVDPQISSQLLIAAKKGLFAEQGLDVTPKLVEAGPDIGPLIAGGTATFSFESNITVIDTAANNVAVHIVAPSANIGGTQGSVLRKGLTLKSPKDLEGMKVGMPEGAGVIIAWRNMAKELGIDLTKIKFINLQPADSVAAFGKGDVDIMSGWEPWITKSLALGGTLIFSGKKAFLPGKTGDVDWMDFYSTSQVTPAFTAKFGGETVESILKALVTATDFVNTNRDDAVKLLSPDLHIPEDQLKEIMGRNVYTMKVDELFKKSNQEISALQVEQKAIKSAPPESTYTDFSFLKKVAADLVVS